MKFLSQLFEAQDTDLMSRPFVLARRKLVFLYLVMVVLIVGLFSGLTIYIVNKDKLTSSLHDESRIILTTEEALMVAKKAKPGVDVIRTEYESEKNSLVYEVYFKDGEELHVDLVKGIIIPTILYQEDIESFFYDEVGEMIAWLALFVFVLAAAGSVFIANATLYSISISVKKQKRFVSDAAHELRNPLAALQTTLESYIRGGDNSKELNEEVAKDLLEEVKRLINISESLLTFEKIELSNDRSVTCSVEEQLQTVTHRLEKLLADKDIVIEKKFASDPLLMDAKDLDTVLYNLLHNAIKFSKKSSKISVSWDGSELIIADFGTGIEPEHLPHIFDRFYKADKSRSLTLGGSGLGLALVADIVHAYGGIIDVQSVVGRGTKFILKF